jgi:hypothetical protein
MIVDPLVGKWSCAETRALTFTAPAGTADATAMSQLMLTVAVSSGKVTAYAQSEAGAPCTLSFTEMGTSAILDGGQTCAAPDGITLTYKMGMAELGSMGLQTNLVFDFAGMLQTSTGAAPLDATGSGTTASLCSKVVPRGSGATGGGGW